MNERILKIACDVLYNRIGANELIQWAINEVLAGNDKPSIILLASLLQKEHDKAFDIFEKAVEETGIEYPSHYKMKIYTANKIAEDIVNGKVNELGGCSLIGQICSELGWPKILSEFGMLAHQMSGHESTGMTEVLASEIMVAANNLINNVHSELALDKD